MRAWQFGQSQRVGFLKPYAALARAAALGRRDVTEQLGTLYQERVEEELGRQWQRRARDPGFQARRSRRRR